MADSQQATVGGGCFWCIEAVFHRVRGVTSTACGYAGGHTENPTYAEVCGGATGHAEVVQLTFDPDIVSYDRLLRVFFTIHDPTQRHRQGPDIGPQYRSIILYRDREQRETAEAVISEMEAFDVFNEPIVTEIRPLEIFYPAEPEHQRYFDKAPDTPYCAAIITPKLQKARQEFPRLLA